MKQSRTREGVAIEVLKNPEQFVSLPRRSDVERVLCIWRLPSFDPHSSWSIFKSFQNGAIHLRRLEHDPKKGLPTNVDDPHIFGCEAKLNDEYLQQVVSELENMQVPIFRKSPYIGIDGTFYGIHFGNIWQGTCVNWWSHPSSEWQPLQHMIDKLTEQFDCLLPVSTLRVIKP